jgi:bis(5'-adenosyl)-triphosphatase
MAAPLLFSTFEVTRQAFHRTALTYAIVNLKPIIPGRTCTRALSPESPPHPVPPIHFFFLDVLVCPTRPIPRITDLNTDELAELMRTVQRVGRVVERAYNADGLTIACQVRTYCTPRMSDGRDRYRNVGIKYIRNLGKR